MTCTVKRQPDERGMVTAELAFGSLFAAGFAVLLAWVVSLLLLLVSCYSIAGEVARQEARGDHSAANKAISAGPQQAKVEITYNEDTVVVRVSLSAQPWASWLPAVPLQAEAQVLMESG